MSSYISLRDVTTQPEADELVKYEFVNNSDLVRVLCGRDLTELMMCQLDEIEYCLGLERGGITKYSGTDLLRAEGELRVLSGLSNPEPPPVRSDMVELLKEGQWALIPSRQDLQIMRDLFLDNHAKGTQNRTKFTDVRRSLARPSCLLILNRQSP